MDFIRQVRQEQGLSLRELARRAEISPTHLSRIERGLCRVEATRVQRIAGALGVAAHTLLNRLPPASLKLPSRYNLDRLFGYPVAEPTGTLRVAYREALYREPGPTLLRELDRQVRPAAFWRAAKLLPRDCNGPEQTLLLHLLTPDAEIQEAHPHQLRLACPVVQPPGRRWLAVVVKAPRMLLAVIPQVKVETHPGQHPQLDFLAAVIHRGRASLVDIELDGPYHEAWRDGKRDEGVRKVGLVPVRFSTEEVYRDDFRVTLLRRLAA